MFKLEIGKGKIDKIISLEFDNNVEKPVSILRVVTPHYFDFNLGEHIRLLFKEDVIFVCILEAVVHQKSDGQDIKQISARSKTHLVVDVTQEPKTWPKVKSVKSLIEEIVQPIGIKINAKSSFTIVPKTFSVSAGETVFLKALRNFLSGIFITTNTGENLKKYLSQVSGKTQLETIKSYRLNIRKTYHPALGE